MTNLKGEFVVRIDNTLYTYENTDDIPQEFDNLIKFNPIPIEGPHTPEEHAENAQMLDIFKEIMSREKKRDLTNF
jgi:hypothetical protein